jgi:hypothetical protein
MNDNFISTCLEGAISIEVWYQNKSKSESVPEEDEYTQTRELSKRWKDVKRHIQFSVAIQELDASGDWESVDVEGHDKIISGGVYRLKQVYIKTMKSLVLYINIFIRVNQNVLSRRYDYFLEQMECHLYFMKYDLLK